ncbi:MAG: MBL fold metallo-hydrolase [Bacteroidota bacterium]
MKIKTFVFNPFYENTLVLSSSKRNCLIFDPGCYESFEINELTEYIETEELSVVAIINTHCHIDHVLGNEAIKNKYNVSLKIPENEKEIYAAMPTYAPNWGIMGYRHAEVDTYLADKNALELDELKLEMIEVPGHSPGHLMFYCKVENFIIGGDVLFRESIGRTDLPGGNHQALINNIKEKVYVLPEEVVIHPGHGPTTTIGHEKRNNPFVRG